MPNIDELERRIIALEKAQNENTSTMKWVVGTLGQIQAAVVDHTERLERIESAVRRLESDIKGLRRDLPGIVADAMRNN